MTVAFKRQMQRLGGLKFAPQSLGTHWEALSDLSDAALEAAVSRAAKECEEFPSPKMLRSFASLTAERIGPDEDRSVPLPEPVVLSFPLAGRDLTLTREWRHYCDVCRDSGWESWHCDANGACGREVCHYPHEYVKQCICWSSNPALIKKRARQAQQANTRTTSREA